MAKGNGSGFCGSIFRVVTRALCNGKTSAFQADDAGSIPAARSSSCVADIAQLVERTLGKGEVGSSTLPISTSLKNLLDYFLYLSENTI